MIHLVTLDFPPLFDGGIASWTLDLAMGLSEAGESVTVHAKSGRGARGFDRGMPFTVRRIEGRSWRRFQGLWVAAQVPIALETGDAVVYATWRLATVLAPRLAGRHRQLVAFHGSDLSRLTDTPAALTRVLAAVDGALPVSGFLAELLEDHGRLAQPMPMPVPVGPQPPVMDPPSSLIAVARLNRLKGIDRVLRIARALDWPLTVVGDGPAREQLEVDARALQVDAEFTGRLPRSHVLERFRGQGAALLLPRSDGDGTGAEGFGAVLLEAMGQGTPAVGCRTGGVVEAVGPGLILDDPDDAERSADQLRAWHDGSRGLEGWRWVRGHHGREAAVGHLLEQLLGRSA